MKTLFLFFKYLYRLLFHFDASLIEAAKAEETGLDFIHVLAGGNPERATSVREVALEELKGFLLHGD